MGKTDKLIIDTNNFSDEFETVLPNIRILHVNSWIITKNCGMICAKEIWKGSLLTLISLKNKEDIKRYAESVDDPDVKECVDRLMILNENTIKSFWNLTTEQENRMMQNTREKLIREKSEKRGLQKGKNIGLAEGLVEGKISIARNMINMNIGKEIIKSATGLSEEEIEKLYLEK